MRICTDHSKLDRVGSAQPVGKICPIRQNIICFWTNCSTLKCFRIWDALMKCNIASFLSFQDSYDHWEMKINYQGRNCLLQNHNDFNLRYKKNRTRMHEKSNNSGTTNPFPANLQPGRVTQSTKPSNTVDTMSRPVQRTSSINFLRSSYEYKDIRISDKIDRKYAEQQHEKWSIFASIVTEVAGATVGESQHTSENSKPSGKLKAQRHNKVGLPSSCNELGCDRAYTKPAELLASHYASKFVKKEHLFRHKRSFHFYSTKVYFLLKLYILGTNGK